MTVKQAPVVSGFSKVNARAHKPAASGCFGLRTPFSEHAIHPALSLRIYVRNIPQMRLGSKEIPPRREDGEARNTAGHCDRSSNATG